MADGRRLVTDATRAFVDRTVIDWDTLLSRVHAGPERSTLENLRLLDSIRQTAGSTQSHEGTYSLAFAAVVAAVAAVQTTAGLVALGIAYLHGETAADRLPQIVLACAFGAASLFLATATSRDRRTIFLLAWFASAASAFARHALTGSPAPLVQTIDVVMWGVAPEAFMPACLWQFASDFPRVLRFTAFDVLARGATAVAWIIGLFLFGANFALTHYSVAGGSLTFLMRGDPSSVFWHVIMLAMIPAVLTILLRSRRAPTPERRRVARLASAIAVGTAPFLLLGLVLTASPSINNWLLTADPAEHLWLDVIVLGGLALTPLLGTRAVIVDRPFELQFLRWTSLFTLARALLSAGPVAPFIPVFVTLYRQRHSSIADIFSNSQAPLLIAYVAAGCVLLAMRSRLVEAFDRSVSRRMADHHVQLTRGLERVRMARGARELTSVVGRELRRGTGAETAAVLIEEADSYVDPARDLTPLPRDSALIAVLHETAGPIDVSAEGPLYALLPSRDREWVSVNDIALITTLKHRDEAIAALLALGPKRGGVPFDRRDAWLITSIVTAAAATWAEEQNVRPAAPASEVAFECSRCGRVSATSPLECGCGASVTLAALPARLGDSLLVERRLGAGGMGVVYLARDAALDREVALKTLPALASGNAARLRDEARAMAALNHESLAIIYGIEIWQRTPVLSVEYFANGTLADTLARGPMPVADVVEMGISLTRALAYMHAAGVLHRDVKPSNVGFTAAGAPKLLDFGLATLVEPASRPFRRGTARDAAPRAGTPAYFPPEAYLGVAATPAFDLWAVSLVFLEAITGVSPFARRDVADTIRRIAPPLLRAFFERALAPRPEERFHTASDLRAALDTLADGRSATR